MVRLSAAVAAALPASAVAETVLGAYIFSRHGDRTSKSTPPANLTTLGYQEVFQSGGYFNSRYVNASSPQHILGLNSDLVKLSQLSVSAPVDNVLLSSATGFLQGLYPPVGGSASAQTLQNSSVVDAPLNGYQIIPVTTITSNAGSEDTTWLQDATGCANAESSSNQYFYSPEYMALYNSTMPFYQSLWAVVNRTFPQSYMSYKNAYTIFDLINVAEIHNASSSIQDNNLITPEVFQQLLDLANAHEYGLAYNASSNIRAIAGMQLAAEIVDYLNGTITGTGKQKLGIQFGAYGTFMSFFGLAGLAGSPYIANNGNNFYGIADYASTMTFELYTDANTTGFPTAAEDIRVRFLYNNGTSTASLEPTVYPLFGQSSLNVSWSDFTSAMAKFSVGNSQQWCQVCGNTTGVCASFQPGASDASTGASSGGSGSMSLAVAGVIGAMVTLGVILLVEGAIILLGGLRLVSKKRLAGSPASSVSATVKA